MNKKLLKLSLTHTYLLKEYGESEIGAEQVCVTIQQLADMDAGTACGEVGNTCFKTLAEKGFKHRKCLCWLMIYEKDECKNPEVIGMFHIKVQTDKTAEKIERITDDAGGSLRFNGDSDIEGYKEFEIE